MFLLFPQGKGSFIKKKKKSLEKKIFFLYIIRMRDKKYDRCFAIFCIFERLYVCAFTKKIKEVCTMHLKQLKRLCDAPLNSGLIVEIFIPKMQLMEGDHE